MRWVGTVISGLFGLIVVAVVIAVFGIASTRFETAVLAMLVMIRVAVVGSSELIERNNATRTLALAGLIMRLGRRVDDPDSDEVGAALRAEVDELRTGTPRYYIHIGVNILIATIALLHLVRVLL